MSWTFYTEKNLCLQIKALLLFEGCYSQGPSRKEHFRNSDPEDQAEHLNALIHIDTLILKYWRAEEALNQSCKETLDWKRSPDKCITLHINYILSTQGVWKGDTATHLEEISLVKKDAFWARSSINFKSSSSIMSSGRASSSSFSSHFLAILEDNVYRLRSRMYSHPCKPAYTFETI